MRLALQTDFALRTLIFLAIKQERVTVADVARFYDISTAHVARVVNLLSRHGYIRSTRGIGGGIELAREPNRITVGEVIRTFEGNLHLLDCVAVDDICAIQPVCSLKGVLAKAEQIQTEYLNSVTLVDVLPTEEQLVSLSLV